MNRKRIGKVPEGLRDLYYWVCENIGTKEANMILDKEYEKFIDKAIQAERDRCANIVKEVMDNCVYGNPDMFDRLVPVTPLHSFDEAINLINNK